MVDGIAQCVFTGACRETSARCTSGTHLETCTNSAWVSSTCANGCVTIGANGVCATNVAKTPITGTFSYIARAVNGNPPTDWGNTFTAPGSGFIVISYANGAVLDATVTGAGGAYTINVPTTPATNDAVVFAAVALDADGIAYTVADPGFASGTIQVGTTPPGPSVWGWARLTSALKTNAAVVVQESEGSGAARVFDYLRYSYETSKARYPSAGPALVVWLDFGVSWSCGACAAPLYIHAFDQDFTRQIWMPGDLSSQGYWSDPVTAHELGHYVMGAYGVSPGEGGPHFIGGTAFPGLAWSEGWATWFSSDIRQSPLYYDKQGTAGSTSFFWFNLSARQYSGKPDGGAGPAWQRPSASADAGLFQNIDENEVAAMAWELSNSSAAAPAALHWALISPRMTTSPFGRGYASKSTGASAPFFADFLDALNCGGFSRSAIDSATDPTTNYPYPSSSPICSAACSPSTCLGCCVNGVCVAGTNVSACGSGGNACATCSANQFCNQGQCKSSACAGCVDSSSTCQAGTSTSACGSNGSTCVACQAGQTCTNGACTGGSCSASNCANGCCNGTTCVTATSSGQCGSGGSACVACTTNQVCSAGACKLGEGQVCTASDQCAGSMVCLLDPGSTTQGTCRNTCTPSSSSCTSGFNCIPLQTGGACVPAPSATSKWNVVFYDATLKSTDPADGLAWDVSNGNPDPFVCATVPNHTQQCSSTKSDTLSPNWTEYAGAPESYNYSDLASVMLDLYDEDLSSNDFVDSYTTNLQCPWAGQPCSAVLDHTSSSSSGSNTLTIYVYPE